MRAVAVLAVLVGAGVALLAIAVGLPWYRRVTADAVAIAEAHLDHTVAHPGWSFPSRVWSAPAPLDLPKERKVLHAKARGYAENCPPSGPGEYCAKSGDVLPRSGNEFEPVLLGVLVGPDSEIREHLPIEEAPDHLVAAILISEDEHFRDHVGVDFFGVARAAWANLRGGGYRQGASTLTMQVVRNLSQEKERSLQRKLREAGMAMAMDAHLGKDGILGIYLDMPYLGQDGSSSICGFQAAARYYWGKDAKDLTLAQSATLASILPAPGRYAPDRNPEEATKRRNRLLTRMGELGWDVTAALEEPMGASRHEPVPPELHPAYLQAVRAELEATLPPEVVYGAGLDVRTAMDVVAQVETETVLAQKSAYLERVVGRRGEGPLLAAGAVIDPRDGALVAAHDTSMVDSNGFNRATQARRQAGSSFKPLVYALAFQPGEDGKPRFRSDHTVPNSWRKFEGTDNWSPRNVGGRYTQTSTLAYGLAASQNIATASLLEELGGPEPLIALAGKIGFDTSKYPRELGLALGQAEVNPQEMARFVATVVNGGHKLSASPIRSAVDADGTEVLALSAPGEQVLTPEAALLTRELMGLVVLYGTGGSARGGGGFPGYDGELIGKTGTTDEEKDVWFVGSSPTYSAALWLGYDQPVRVGGSASDLAAPLFGWWMRAVHTGLPREKFDDTGVESHWVCNQTGKIPMETCKGIAAPYLKGERPKGVCDGTHPPETGESLEEHQSLWEKMEAARLEAEGAEGDTDTP